MNISGKDSPAQATSPSESLGGWVPLRGKGRWTDSEDAELSEFVRKYGAGSWKKVAERTSLNRDAQSCRLRWASYLDPNVSPWRASKAAENKIEIKEALRSFRE